QYLPATHAEFTKLAASIGGKAYSKQVKKCYKKLENISVDYAILERATAEDSETKVFEIPADMGWSDIGSWAAVYELLAEQSGANVIFGPGHTLDGSGNYIFGERKFIAAIGVKDLVIVETKDALLVCSRERAQDVGKLVKWLEEK